MTLWAGMYLVVFTYIPKRAIHSGIDTQRAEFLVSVIGISCCASKVVFGFIGNNSSRVRLILIWISSASFGISSCFVSELETYTHLCVYTIICGITTGCTVSIFPVVVVDIVGIEALELGMGMVLSFCGPILLMAPPLSGVMIEQTGSLDMPFWIFGGLCAAGSMALLPILINSFNKCMPKDRTKNNNAD